jgi:hypothetical protein
LYYNELFILTNSTHLKVDQMAGNSNRYVGKPQLHQLKHLVDGDGLRSLSGRHQIGRIVEQLIPSNRRSYGEREFAELTEAVGLPAKSNILAVLRNFAKTYGTAAAVRQLEKTSPGSAYRLTWSLVVRLMSFPPGQREQLTNECRTGEWSAAELDRRIRQIRARRHKGGPRLKRPRDVVDGLLQAQLHAENWIKRAEQLWTGGEQPAVTAEAVRAGGAEAARIAQETAAVLKHLQAAVESFQKVLHAVKSRSQGTRKRSK